MEDKIDGERRALLKVAALAGASGLVSGVPVLAYVTAPALTKGRGNWFDFGSVENLPRGRITMLTYKFMDKDGWVVLPRRGIAWAKAEADGRLTIFSSVCSHLGCSVSWRDETKSFDCPCHSGRFDASGRPIAGPVTRPLMALEHKVENGNLLVLLPA